MKIGFIGLGQMGKPMAMNMLKQGGELIVHVRTERPHGFLSGHVQVTTDLREVAGGEMIFLCLPGSEAVQEVLFGERGLSGFLKKGQIIVDLSTITYKTTLEVYQRLQEQGVHFLDAPVSGMEDRAREGTLTVMCGGSREVFLRVEPFLTWIGTNVLYMGKAGSGQLTKLSQPAAF
jgi:3-hydroxyisobutyrate dehydrogenase-like beta-hydroxyacid dehydrogenase